MVALISSNLLPMVSTGKIEGRYKYYAADKRKQRTWYTGSYLFAIHRNDYRKQSDEHCIGINGMKMLAIESYFVNEIGRYCITIKAEKILNLAEKYNNCNATGKSYYYRIRHKLDKVAYFQQPEYQHHNAGQNGGNQQAIQPKLLNNAIQHNNKGACGAGNLHPASTQQRYEKSTKNRCYQAFFRAHPRSNSEGYG